MPHCRRASCFQVRLEAAAAPGERTGARDSCGAHLAEVVQELALWAREHRRGPARVVVYATTGRRRSTEPGPFDRLAFGAIPV